MLGYLYLKVLFTETAAWAKSYNVWIWFNMVYRVELTCSILNAHIVRTGISLIRLVKDRTKYAAIWRPFDTDHTTQRSRTYVDNKKH